MMKRFPEAGRFWECPGRRRDLGWHRPSGTPSDSHNTPADHKLTQEFDLIPKLLAPGQEQFRRRSAEDDFAADDGRPRRFEQICNR